MIEIVGFITTLEVVACLIGLVVFAVSYGWFFNWRLTAAGSSLMYFVLSLLSLVIVSGLRELFGIESVQVLIGRSIVFTFLTFTTWRLVWVLWHTPPLTHDAASTHGHNRRNRP